MQTGGAWQVIYVKTFNKKLKERLNRLLLDEGPRPDPMNARRARGFT